LFPNSVNRRLFLCHGFNTLAYNPNIKYTPWRGKDSAGVEYKDAWLYDGGTDAAPNFNVRNNPYNASGSKTNLAASGVMAYWPWTDSNGNGRYDPGECGNTSSNAGGVSFASLSDEQKKNFANWWSYYRKREYVIKRAVSELVKFGRVRMGLATLHNNNSVGTPIRDVDDISTPVNATAQTDKENLLRNISRIYSSGGTPLRLKLDQAGRYYMGTVPNDFFGFSPTHSDTIDPKSPILNAAKGGACQQNFTVLMTDGYYNSGYGGTNVGNADGDNSSVFDGGPYGDSQSNTLADIAMYYYERDLRSDLPNRVPYLKGKDPLTPGTATPGDSASDDQGPDPEPGTLMHQHMVTYGIAFGLSGNLDPFNKTPSVCDSDPTNACWVGWPNQTPAAMEDTPDAVDDLWHAAYNSRGQFLSANNPSALLEAFNRALADIYARSSAGASAAIVSGMYFVGNKVYIPRFRSGDWSGELIVKELKLNSTTNKYELADPTSGWTNAADVLKTQHWDTGRRILTWNGTSGIPFRWSNLTASQQNALRTNPATGTLESVTAGQQRLAYLRGDHSLETPNGPFRRRENGFVLGDIVHSPPVYVGIPSAGHPDYLETVPYTSFRGSHYNREPMLYVGANDGMLHGFSAVTGEERLAYVPGRVFSKLAALTDPGYPHYAYADGPVETFDVFYNNAWHTILVGSLRAGGQGIYALDVTDPAAFSEANAANLVLWEFTDANDKDLGYTYGRPIIAKTNYQGKWAVILGNGYNNTESDGNQSTTGRGALYILFIEDGLNGWSAGDYVKIEVPAGTPTTPNGLATPAVVDVNGDGKADYVYAGDLRGNIWKFDISSSNKNQWKLASNSPLFTAVDGSGNPQPITSAPEVTRHPVYPDGIMVIFGTGKYIEGHGLDAKNTQQQTLYGIWDKQGIGNGPFVSVSKNQLLTQVITQTTSNGAPVRIIDPPKTIAANQWGTGPGQYMGWQVNLPAAGERAVYDPLFVDDERVLFTTIVPDSDPCGRSKSWIIQLNYANGGPPSFPSFDVDQDGLFTGNDNANGQVVMGVQRGEITGNPPIVYNGDGSAVLVESGGGVLKEGGTDKIPGDPNVGRQSWRQIQ
jgi:type IV pilus assembly protein PilY1